MKLRVGGALLAVLTAATLAACGDGSDAGSAADASAKYRDCLSRNGVTLPSFGPRPSGVPTVRPTDRPTARASVRPSIQPAGPGTGGFGRFPQVDASVFAKAQQACASLHPSGQPGFGDFGGDRRPGGNGDGRSAAFRNCMAEHGVTLQDGHEPDASDPKVAAALKTCAVLRPSPSPAN